MEPAEDGLMPFARDEREDEAVDRAATHVDLGEAVPPTEITTDEIVDDDLGDGEGAGDAGLLDNDACDEDLREVEAIYGRELGRAKDKVSRWRATQVKEAFRIADHWADLIARHSVDEVSAFLASECQIPRRDVARYARLSATLSSRRELFIEKGVAVSVLLDLAAASEDVREEAIRMIKAGRSLQAKELRGLKRDIHLARAAREDLPDMTRVRDLKNAAARAARKAASCWLASLETLTNEVIALTDLDRFKSVADFEAERVAKLARNARELLTSFPVLPAEGSKARKEPDRCFHGSWADVKAALQRVAGGKVFVEELYEKPFTKMLVFDEHLLWHLAWAFGYDDDSSPERAAERLREAGKAPLDTNAKPGRVRAEAVGKPGVLEICAGAGGQALGLEAAGFEHAGLVEIDEDAVATLKANGPKWPVLHADLRDLDLSAHQGVDLLAGGVPCQPYSSAGERRGSHDERDLFPEALRLVRELKPKAVLLENVTGALHSSNSVNRLRILSELAKLGYDAEWRILEGPEFGLPQNRRRAVLVGFRPGMMHRFRWPVPLQADAPTIGEALRDLMGAEGWPHVDEWARKANGSAPTLIGGSQKKQSIDLAQDVSRKRWRELGVDPNGRAEKAPGPDAPADFKPKLTLAMLARLQDFPDSWQFRGKPVQVYRQIANAFPPCMAQAVGASIMRALTGSEIDLPAALKVPRRRKPGGLNFDLVRSLPSTEDIDEMA